MKMLQGENIVVMMICIVTRLWTFNKLSSKLGVWCIVNFIPAESRGWYICHQTIGRPVLLIF